MVDVDGATLEVLVGGGGRSVICVAPHPVGGQLRGGGPLSDIARVVKVNPRGLGSSSPVREARELTLDQLAVDMEAVRERLDIGR